MPQQELKRGAGLLFFAYGGEATLQHFLHEARNAARSFRAAGAAIRIGVVTNNDTVDSQLFDIHIQPRSDLLFPGDPCPYKYDKAQKCDPAARPRQWITRLYYLAMSPFELTWALDSNTACCDPRAAASFLSLALESQMWGFNIATASQGKRSLYYPHNWNILYRWTGATSNMMRDWLLLQMRRGLSADDQGTLFAAMQRQRAAGGLRVGQMPTPFATAFYSPTNKFFPRITRPVTAPVVVFHTKANTREGVRAWCGAFNEAKGAPRQFWIPRKNAGIAALRSVEACKAAIGTPHCPFHRSTPGPPMKVYSPRIESVSQGFNRSHPMRWRRRR